MAIRTREARGAHRCAERGRGLRACLTGLALFLPACGFGAPPEWTPGEVAQLYGVVLEALHEEVAGADTLFVDQRPRFLVADGPTRVRMDDFNRYGDPPFSSAIAGAQRVAACRPAPGGDCSRAEHAAFATVSEVFPLGGREAVVLASHVTLEDGRVSPRGLFFHLRFRGGEWRVTRIGEGEGVEVDAALALPESG